MFTELNMAIRYLAIWLVVFAACFIVVPTGCIYAPVQFIIAWIGAGMVATTDAVTVFLQHDPIGNLERTYRNS